MKIWPFATNYVTRWWLPPLVALIALGLFLLTMVADLLKLRCEWLQITLLGALGVSLLGILVSAVWNFFKKRWKAGAIQLFLLLTTGMVSMMAIGVVCFAMAFGPSEDGFADHLTIPTDIEIALPLESLKEERGAPEDTFQTAVLKTLETPGSGDASLTAHLPSLAQLQKMAPEILQRYLVTSLTWRVHRDRGKKMATRRWMAGSTWSCSNGNYSHLKIYPGETIGRMEYQTHTTLDFSGKSKKTRNADWAKEGERFTPKLREDNHTFSSYCMIALDGVTAQIMEQSDNPERRLTKAALQQIEEELCPLVGHPDEATLRRLLPPGSIQQGAPSLDMRNSIQPGIYESVLWVNPGEPGMIYLKAFEVTHETPLSVDRLKESSNEWVGWSENPNEQFFSNTNFTIYEGDWGKPYAARFEVWFVPDSGKPERKLLERKFKIEGWQR